VSVDALRLRQILTNLVGNAVKFTEDGGYVLVSVINVEEKDGNVSLRFTVEDVGIGIKEDRVDHIFGSFSQADSSTTKKYGGTGLGLSISKQLVEMMGGTISVQSTLGIGTIFFFDITVPVCERSKPSPEGKLDDLSGKRVLVVDDSHVAQIIFSDCLKIWGMDHEVVSSGKEALAELEKSIEEVKPYDIIISDYCMPEMDGKELAQTIRNDDRFNNIKLILATAVGKTKDLDALMNAGFIASMLKPIYPDDFFKTLMGVAAQSEETFFHKEEEEEHVSFDARILLVEDDLVNQMVAQELLESLDCIVDIANNGAEAVEMVGKSDYDLIFMDCMMPVMDGYEATGQIRKNSPDSSDHIIVAMTANVMDDDEQKCLSAGMDHYITKPAKEKDLRMVLGKYLSDKRVA